MPDLDDPGLYENRIVIVEGLTRDITMNGRTGTVVKWRGPEMVLVEIEGRQGWMRANHLRCAAGQWSSWSTPAAG